MLTLTFPHDPRLSVQGRIEVAFAVWTEFLRKFNSWKKKNKSNSVRWFRAFEWEPGSDGKGHPHFHVWLFCPFLERVAIERWLKDSYSLVTGEIAPETLAFDIRMLTGTDKDAREIIKYITKDIDAKGNIIDPELFAQVYEVVDGKRTTQASRGFMGLAKKSVPCSCGASNCWEVEVINDTKAVE